MWRGVVTRQYLCSVKALNRILKMWRGVVARQYLVLMQYEMWEGVVSINKAIGDGVVAIKMWKGVITRFFIIFMNIHCIIPKG